MDMDLSSINGFTAQNIIEKLRKGTVPIEHVSLFTVGRDKWLHYVRNDLTDYIGLGGAKVRFINGDYGDGKTHFMSVIQHISHQENFAVSFVVITRDIPLHKFECVYRELVNQLQIKDYPKGIQGILEHWIEGLSKEQQEEVYEKIPKLKGINTSFANAICALVKEKHHPLEEGETEDVREDAISLLYRWFQGERLAKRSIKPFSIFECLDKTNNKSFLKSLIALLRYIGCQGLILLVDEVETVMSQSTSIRAAAFENIRLLIDSTDDSEFFEIFFSIIPDVIGHEKGFRSYDALWTRVRSLGGDQRLNYRGVLLDLHRTPLGEAEFLQLGRRLRDIHGIAYSWNSSVVKDEHLRTIYQEQEQLGMMSEIRTFIRKLIYLLDIEEQNVEVSPKKEIISNESIVKEEKNIDQANIVPPMWDQ